MEDDRIIYLGFDPKPIHYVISRSKVDVPEIGNEFDELEMILKEAIDNQYLIGVHWG